jgi:cyclophilin family peptidyl-prolyl cis-trans isomerase
MNLPRALVPAFLALLALAFAGCGKGDDDDDGAHAGDPIGAADAFIAKKAIDKSWKDWRLRLPKPPQFTFATDKKVYWTLETTKGRVVARLWHEVAPLHVSSFIYLTRLGFFDGLLIHRVVKGFMAQGGCPYSLIEPSRAGQGWPGYQLPLEYKGLKHDRAGLLSTANAGGTESDGSQFFITFAPTPGLDPNERSRQAYTLFGEVVEGMEAVRAMEAVGAPPMSPPDKQGPSERIVINKATVEVR